MSGIAKFLVLINGLLSLIFLTWSIALHTEQVPEKDQTVGTEKIQGRIDQFNRRIAAESNRAGIAIARWGRYNQDLVGLENERPLRQDGYFQLLKTIREGKDLANMPIDKAAGPARELTINPVNGLIELQVDPDTRKLTPPGKPLVAREGENLDSIINYDKELRLLVEQIDGKQKAIQKLIASEEVLTAQIHGTDAKKGLRTLVREQESVITSAKGGIAFLTDIITTREAESRLFDRRRGSLRNRVGELKVYLEKDGSPKVTIRD
jgi:hypothetical protein